MVNAVLVADEQIVTGTLTGIHECCVVDSSFATAIQFDLHSTSRLPHANPQ